MGAPLQRICMANQSFNKLLKAKTLYGMALYFGIGCQVEGNGATLKLERICFTDIVRLDSAKPQKSPRLFEISDEIANKLEGVTLWIEVH